MQKSEDFAAYHAIEQVQGSETDRFVFVVQTLQDEVLMRLHWLRVGLQDLWHGQQAQVLHCGEEKHWSVYLIADNATFNVASRTISNLLLITLLGHLKHFS